MTNPAVQTGTAVRPRGGRRVRNFALQLSTAREFIGFTKEDERRVHETREVLSAHAHELSARVYDRLLSHPQTAAYFQQTDGRIDREYVTVRHDALIEWLQMAVTAPLDADLANHLAAIGRAHAGRGGTAEARVPGRHLVITMSHVQTLITRLLGESIADRAELIETTTAWNKLLMIHLDLLLSAYSSAVGTIHWY